MTSKIDYRNTKVYTTDPEVIEKYAVLCGAPTMPRLRPESDHGVWYSGYSLYMFTKGSPVCLGLTHNIKTLSPETINMEYDKLMQQKESEENVTEQATQYVYELVEDLSTDEIAIAMIKGEVFYNESGERSYHWTDGRFVNHFGIEVAILEQYYRRKEVSWKDKLNGTIENAVICWGK